MTHEAIHCYDRGTVRFAVYPAGPDGPRLLAEISEDALRDVFGVRGGPEALVQACQLHFDTLADKVARRFEQDPRQSPIVLGTPDFAGPAELVRRAAFRVESGR